MIVTTDLSAVDAAQLAAVVVTPAVYGAGAAPGERPSNRGGGQDSDDKNGFQ